MHKGSLVKVTVLSVFLFLALVIIHQQLRLNTLRKAQRRLAAKYGTLLIHAAPSPWLGPSRLSDDQFRLALLSLQGTPGEIPDENEITSASIQQRNTISLKRFP
jgi:hypothetical protein